MRWIQWSWCVALAAAGCTNEYVTEPPAPPLLDEPCEEGGLECADGECYLGASFGGARSHTCQVTCATSADCPSGRLCSVASDGGRVCAAVECAPDEGGTVFCIDGVPTACEQAPCGCSCPAGEYCSDGLACVPQRGAGESCVMNRDCSTGACLPSGLCQVELGAACTSATCARCMGTGPNAFCTRSCRTSAEPSGPDCPETMGCIDLIGNYPGEYDAQVCRPSCGLDSDCPEGWSCHDIYFQDLGRDYSFCYDDAEYNGG